MKRYLGLESKSFGICSWPWPPGRGTDSFGLGFGICGLTASALWRIPLGAMTYISFYLGDQIDARGAGTIFLLLGQAAPLPFFSFSSLPVSLPFLSRPLEVGPYSSPSLPSIPFPSHANY